MHPSILTYVPGFLESYDPRVNDLGEPYPDPGGIDDRIEPDITAEPEPASTRKAGFLYPHAKS